MKSESESETIASSSKSSSRTTSATIVIWNDESIRSGLQLIAGLCIIHLLRAGRTSLHFQVLCRLWCHLLSWKVSNICALLEDAFYKDHLGLPDLCFLLGHFRLDGDLIISWWNKMHRGLFYLNCNLLGIHSAMGHLFRAVGQNPHFQAIFWLSKHLSGNKHNHVRELVWLPQESQSVLSQSPFLQPVGRKCNTFH